MFDIVTMSTTEIEYFRLLTKVIITPEPVKFPKLSSIIGHWL